MKRLFRSKDDSVISGICGGIAKRFNFDSTIVRLVFVFAFIMTGFFPIGLFYIIAWIIVPLEENDDANKKDAMDV